MGSKAAFVAIDAKACSWKLSVTSSIRRLRFPAMNFESKQERKLRNLTNSHLANLSSKYHGLSRTEASILTQLRIYLSMYTSAVSGLWTCSYAQDVKSQRPQYIPFYVRKVHRAVKNSSERPHQEDLRVYLRNQSFPALPTKDGVDSTTSNASSDSSPRYLNSNSTLWILLGHLGPYTLFNFAIRLRYLFTLFNASRLLKNSSTCTPLKTTLSI